MNLVNEIIGAKPYTHDISLNGIAIFSIFFYFFAHFDFFIFSLTYYE